jgi:hypothetical protein
MREAECALRRSKGLLESLSSSDKEGIAGVGCLICL